MLGRTTDDLVARFGWLRGLRLAAQLRLLKILRAGTLVHCDVPLLAQPIHLRARTSDASVLKEILRGDIGALPFPASPAFIVDAGANVGLISALFATRFPAARIAALELDPANFRLLERNVRSYPNVTAIHAGLWSHSTELTIANPDAESWGYRAEERGGGGQGVRVQARSVSDILRDFGIPRINILKVDIEGGEMEVFNDASEEWLGSVDQIVIELHERLVPGCERAVMERLRSRFDHRRAGDLDLFVRKDRVG